jgi:feruloyl esterase
MTMRHNQRCPAELSGGAMRLGLLIAMVLTLAGWRPSHAQAAELADLKAVAPVVSCESLAGADLSSAAQAPVKISAARVIPSPVGQFCRVEGVIAPAIGFEVDLPMDGWRQRYLQTGCGGLCGMTATNISHAGGCELALRGGLVVASDNMGHAGGPGVVEGAFGEDPQKRIDFAYRGNHVTALVAKRLIKLFYGQGPRYAYFSGCSDGGREALIEAQRFPEDFDGIAAGAPAMNFQVQNSFYHAWQYHANTRADGSHILLKAKLPILHQAALTACDALDGLRDGLISDPRACHFDIKTVQCASDQGDASHCLTAEEVRTASLLYAGPTDAAGRHFTIGGPQPGSELAWAGVYVPETADGRLMSGEISRAASQYLIFPAVAAADGDIQQFAFTEANFARLAALHPLYDATDTDLAPFQRHGGKLILWHGWSDPHISPINTIAYYDAVKRLLGADKTDAFARLFLFAGMYHCDGGDGFSQFDVLTPLMAWVESARAPNMILAAQVAQRPAGPPPMGPPPNAQDRPPLPRPDRPVSATRPIYPYPMVAKYTGQGSDKEAANFVAAPPNVSDPAAPAWEGASFLGPDFQRSYGVKDGKLMEEQGKSSDR